MPWVSFRNSVSDTNGTIHRTIRAHMGYYWVVFERDVQRWKAY